MTTPELAQWLRDNSSGIYRPCAEAADLIEDLERRLTVARVALERIAKDGTRPASMRAALPHNIAREALAQTAPKP